MNTVIIIITGLILILLVAFLVKRNRIDQNEYENQVNQDYPHSTDSPEDVDAEEKMH
jgi:uncharacterized protein YxeA